MATQMADPTTVYDKKSGKGIRDGVVSELTAFFGVKPGHAAELKAAVERFADALRTIDPNATQRTGLRDSRHVLFDNDTRLLWTTTFETDWDPYLDDALMIVGVDRFIDWMQHTTEAELLGTWLRAAGGADALRQAQAQALDGSGSTPPPGSSALKRIIQSVQLPGTAYFSALATEMIPEIRKAARVEQAFQQVLDAPNAAEALQHPALAPLLDEAAD